MACECPNWGPSTCVDGRVFGMHDPDNNGRIDPDRVGECRCWDECCNAGRWADDGDGYMDFMPDRSTCGCKEEAK